MSVTSMSDPAAQPPLNDIARIARDAVLFTYPLYEMARMRAAASARRDAEGKLAGGSAESTLRWMNQWVHTRQLLGPQNREVVTQ
jgi:hypothetical protein